MRRFMSASIWTRSIRHSPHALHIMSRVMSVRDILSVLHRIDAPIVGADVVEYNPTRDINGMTAVVAAKFVKELAAIAAR